jgi:hypothetical protein
LCGRRLWLSIATRDIAKSAKRAAREKHRNIKLLIVPPILLRP